MRELTATTLLVTALFACGPEEPEVGTTAQVLAYQEEALAPIEDAYLENGVRRNNDLLRVENSIRRERISYLKFTVPAGTSPSGAELRLRCSRDDSAGEQLRVSVHLGGHNNWSERSLSPSTAPAAVTALSEQTLRFRSGDTYAFDVSAAVTGGGTYTFVVQATSHLQDVAFGSREGGLRPQLVLLAQRPSTGVRHQFEPTADLFLEDGARRGGAHLRVQDSPSRERVSYLKFNVTDAGAVNDATLRLRCRDDEGTLNLRIFAGDHSAWTEADLTPASAPAAGQLLSQRQATYRDGRDYDFDVSALVAGDGTYTFVLQTDTGDSDAAFSSREGGAPPLLIVNAGGTSGGPDDPDDDPGDPDQPSTDFDDPTGACEDVFLEQGGRVIMEVESAPRSGAWVLSRQWSGFTGRGYYNWTGENNFRSHTSPHTLEYRFRIERPGVYDFTLRNRHDNPDHTLENDHWVSMDDRYAYKAHAHVVGRWDWKIQFGSRDPDPVRPPTKFFLNAGHHVLRIAPRSRGFRIDRIALCREGVSCTSTSLPESPKACRVPQPLTSTMNPSTDLVALHYDHAKDRDDGHSAVADLSMKLHTPFRALVVSGTTGINLEIAGFNEDSDVVMDAAWGAGGWLDAYRGWGGAVQAAADAWLVRLDAGGDVWIKEGGQSDFTADVVRELLARRPGLNTRQRIHLVQHGAWNEHMTTVADLAYVWEHTDYLVIENGNFASATADLAEFNANQAVYDFVALATAHPTLGTAWEVAFDYLDPVGHKLDFSDSVELLFILGVPKSRVADVTDFADRYLRP